MFWAKEIKLLIKIINKSSPCAEPCGTPRLLKDLLVLPCHILYYLTPSSVFNKVTKKRVGYWNPHYSHTYKGTENGQCKNLFLYALVFQKCYRLPVEHAFLGRSFSQTGNTSAFFSLSEKLPSLNPLQPCAPFLYPLKTWKNLIFRGCNTGL